MHYSPSNFYTRPIMRGIHVLGIMVLILPPSSWATSVPLDLMPARRANTTGAGATSTSAPLTTTGDTNTTAAVVTSTGGALTITLKVDPSPTNTGSAIAALYSAYAQACGPSVARQIQDTLAIYNARNTPNPPVNAMDPGFTQFLQGNPAYANAQQECSTDLTLLNNAEDEVEGTTSSTATPTPLPTSSPRTGTAGSPSPTASTGAARRCGPQWALFLTVAWLMHLLLEG
ncbi:hypothetical protein DFH07DRAFT_73371 [Mycena maculata]|uniref:Uncharacterized protein n=1 Tax=Mycena maculata TaxID=230809 RepID=A0AAD7NUR2_9AGAR|nr:hypothetical protein DFH07DRAFT_73371 [Mycena maculata]